MVGSHRQGFCILRGAPGNVKTFRRENAYRLISAMLSHLIPTGSSGFKLFDLQRGIGLR